MLSTPVGTVEVETFEPPLHFHLLYMAAKFNSKYQTIFYKNLGVRSRADRYWIHKNYPPPTKEFYSISELKNKIIHTYIFLRLLIVNKQ